MKPAYAREYLQWGLRPARKAAKHPALSGVVYVVDQHGKGAAKIQFNEAFADAVGMALPQGISPEHPAYVKAMETPAGAWRVFALYVREERGALLWETEIKPEWIKTIKRPDHGKNQKNASCRPSRESVKNALARDLRRARTGGSRGGR